MSRATWPTLCPVTPEWETFGLALEDRGPTPCHGSDAWTSDDPAPRAAAVVGCRACPLAQLCHDAAESTREAWGVFGGIDRGDLTKTAERTA